MLQSLLKMKYKDSIWSKANTGTAQYTDAPHNDMNATVLKLVYCVK